MDARQITVAVLAVLVASCSGAVYDSSDFATARRAADPVEDGSTSEVADEETLTTAETEPEATADDDAEPETAVATGTDDAETDDTKTDVAEAGDNGGDDASPSPALAGTPGSTARGLLAFFRTPQPTPEAAAARDAAEEAITPAAPELDEPEIEEVTEAELAGEVEADPDEIAVPTEPINDGLSHDFVNVYTSRPEAIEPTVAGLPGVNWPSGIVLVSRGSDGDPRDLFGGGDHPFARTVPGVPRQTIQAANGLLLAHSAINVSCVKPQLLNLVRRAETHFGKKVVVTSGYRSPAHNRRVRGATHSQHMYCNALDLYMPGVARDDLARFFFAQSDRGGIGLYCHTRSIHVDTGKRRQWRWGCRRRAG
ncbi:MAG TPA: D-Ala-D-Ala carboxypeptidase family metallohydrolase [Methylomirabilota bacterium]|nr:D-Ala-D-Ala carboxypeptidase family metallohydrolase [Methylomirabilota bacterium]